MEEIIKHHFKWIDQYLARNEVPVHKRVLPAAIKFVEECIITSNIDPTGWAPGKSAEFVQQRWFRVFYSYAESWYRERYGARVRDNETSVFKSVVLIAGTPFEVRVPMTRSTPEVVGETLVLSFPGSVSPDENSLDWVVSPPNFDSYSAADRAQAREAATSTSNHIRAISCRSIGAELTDHATRAVLAGVRIHLHSAVELILREDEEGRVPRAQWELQMACESAYKAVLQQHTGEFPPTHDLFMLHEKAKPLIGRVANEWLKSLPRWTESANLRYGLGDVVPTLVDIVDWYTIALKIIGGVLEGLKGHKLDKATMTLKMPSWHRPYDDAAG